MAPRKRHLHAATEQDVAAAEQKQKPLSIVEAAKAGDDLAELRAMRAICAEAMQRPNISGRDLAALSRRQIEIGREIRALEAEEGEGDDDKPLPDEEIDASAF